MSTEFRGHPTPSLLFLCSNYISFSITSNPEGILARDTAAKSEGAKETKSLTIILAGASNLASLRPAFEANGAVVIDLTKPGWMINESNESNVESLKSELSAISNMEDAAIIFDLFGNTTYRFEHVDGSLVLPIKVGGGGRHHLQGDVHKVSDNTIGELINMVKPLFVLAALFLTVIMPPIPRNVFVGCCRESGHSTNVGSAEQDPRGMSSLSQSSENLFGWVK